MEKRTGVPSPTFLAWERRHGVPCPRRDDQKRRHYSEQDIADIEWLRDQTARGLRVADVARQLLASRASSSAPSGEDVVVSMAANRALPDHVVAPALPDGTQPGTLVERFVDAFAALDASAAATAMAELALASSAHAATDTLVHHVLPVLAGRAGPNGVAPVARRFADEFAVRHIDAYLASLPGTTSMLVTAIGPATHPLAVARVAFARAGEGVRPLRLDWLSVADLVDAILLLESPEVVLVTSTEEERRLAAYVADRESAGLDSPMRSFEIVDGTSTGRQTSAHGETPTAVTTIEPRDLQT